MLSVKRTMVFVFLSFFSVALIQAPTALAKETSRGKKHNTPKAKKLNKLGLRAYKAKDYEKAVELFQQAIKADPTHAWAHFNLACTFGVGDECMFDCNNEDTAIEHLKLAIKYKPAIHKKLLKDTDLNRFHTKVAFQLLVGLSLKKTKDVQKIIRKTVWWSPTMDVTDTPNELRFKADGTLVIKGAEFGEGVEKVPFVLKGTYTVRGNKIMVKMKGEDKPYIWIITPDGKLKEPGKKDILYEDYLEQGSA